MAKRKSRPEGGSKLHPIKDYRSDQYVPYIFKAETGILQAWTINSDIRDGDVREALRGLISTIKKSDELPEALTDNAEVAAGSITIKIDSTRPKSLLQRLILINLRSAFQEHGNLEAEDTAGVLTVVNNSVGAWNRGMRGQEYLNYIKGFLGDLGVHVRQLSADEVEISGLAEPKKRRKKLWGIL